MSDSPKSQPEVPEGQSRDVITRQKKANEKGYVGNQISRELFQKVVKHETPKRPLFRYLPAPRGHTFLRTGYNRVRMTRLAVRTIAIGSGGSIVFKWELKPDE